MKNNNLHLMWFRQDLRLLDNTALSTCCEQAIEHNTPVIAIYYLTPEQWQQHYKSLWQIDLILRQLVWLQAALAERNIGLVVRTVKDFKTQAEDLFIFCQTQGINQVFANREYLIDDIQRDSIFQRKAKEGQIDIHWFDDSYIVAPNCITNQAGEAYKVFTPFYKRWLALLDTSGINIIESPKPQAFDTVNYAQSLRQADKTPTITEFYHQFYANQRLHTIDSQDNNPIAPISEENLISLITATADERYPAGEDAAFERLLEFLAEDSDRYAITKDFLGYHELQGEMQGTTSRLSAYLSLGIISARVCYQQGISKIVQVCNKSDSGNADQNLKQGYESDVLVWIRQLAWRDFYANIVVSRPDIVKGKAFLDTLDKVVAWRYDKTDFTKWCQGQTGVPLVDAAMRCLNATGFMHNRLRLVVSMYLTKNLLIDWRWGERYFMNRLVDGDFSNNNGGWQWSASIGTDAQPYFRVMNPFSQALNYDSDAIFIKQWLPCLATIPSSVLHNESKLQAYLRANPQIDYPQLAISTKISRAEAIAAFKLAKFIATTELDEGDIKTIN